jgi:4-hydroxybenzoate polyprenyltransferase
MKNYLILIRPYGMLFLGFAPVFAAIANGEFNYFNLTLLLVIGLLAHIFTFVQNDYYDIEIDSKSKFVSNRPLVKGNITQKKAFAVFFSSFLISIIISIVFLFSLYSFVVLLISFLLMTLYNKYSKKHFGMEYILGMGVFTYGIFGALAVSNVISSLAIIVSFFGFMQWLFSVGVSANLKDVEYDSKFGIKTTPMILGVKATKDKLIIPLSFKIYAVGIKIFHIISASLPFYLGYTSIFVYNFPIPLFFFLIISFILIYLTIKILTTPIKKREKMLISAGLQEGLALLLLPISLLSILMEKFGGIQTLLFILLFIFWPLFWFRVLYGKKMIPLE